MVFEWVALLVPQADVVHAVMEQMAVWPAAASRAGPMLDLPWKDSVGAGRAGPDGSVLRRQSLQTYG